MLPRSHPQTFNAGGHDRVLASKRGTCSRAGGREHSLPHSCIRISHPVGSMEQERADPQ